MLRQQFLTKTASIHTAAKASPLCALSTTNTPSAPPSNSTKRRHTNTQSSRPNKKRQMSSSRRSPFSKLDPGPGLERFVRAQAGVGVWGDTYDEALRELQCGRMRGHWIWYVLPQVAGLSLSGMGKRFSVYSLDQARAYLAHPTLGARLKEATGVALTAPTKDVEELSSSPRQDLRKC